MSDSFLIRWTLGQETLPDEAGDLQEKRPHIDLQLTNANGHRIYVNALLWKDGAQWRALKLMQLHGLKTRYGQSFSLDPFEAAPCRPVYGQALVEALREDRPFQVFLAHSLWPLEVRPIESFWLDGALVDRAALNELQPD